jgi:hypothetical protein
MKSASGGTHGAFVVVVPESTHPRLAEAT